MQQDSIAAHFIKKLPAFYETEDFLFPQNSASEPYPEMDEPSAHPQRRIPLKFVLILSFHVRLDIPFGLFSSDFPIKSSYAFLIAVIRATLFAHLILRDLTPLIK
jgi:hypothetical protein